MAFFGVTMLGPQDGFAASVKDALDISLFSEEECRRAFNRLDVDRSHTITVDELKPLLTDLYHGEPPEKELKRVFAKFDKNADGKITWAEFKVALAELQSETKDDYADKEHTEFKTSSEIREAMRRHRRVAKDPKDKLAKPLSTAQEYGWEKDAGVRTVRYPKQSCAETAYIDAMVKSGQYLL